MIRLTEAAPKRVPNWDWKWEYLVKHYGPWCPISISIGLHNFVDCLHHAGVHNVDANRRAFPLLVHSVLNIRPANNAFHVSNGSWGKISLLEAEKWERFLERHPRIAAWVNGNIKILWEVT